MRYNDIKIDGNNNIVLQDINGCTISIDVNNIDEVNNFMKSSNSQLLNELLSLKEKLEMQNIEIKKFFDIIETECNKQIVTNSGIVGNGTISLKGKYVSGRDLIINKTK
jgi:hypothetical protein